jgi:glycosyltransferase involved in cell wall biosynthesis
VQKQEPYEVIVNHEPDGTIASTRNNAAAQATGDFLLFLDGDDELRHGFLHAISRAHRGGGRVLYTPAVSYVRNGRAARPKFWPRIHLQQGNWLIIGTLVPRVMFEEVGGFRDWPHGLEDWDFFCRLWQAGCEIVPVQRAVYVCYVNPESKHKQLMADRNRHLYWHQKVGHDVWGPDVYEPTTRQEDRVQMLLEGRRPYGNLRRTLTQPPNARLVR